jgi:hypothetical protein
MELPYLTHRGGVSSMYNRPEVIAAMCFTTNWSKLPDRADSWLKVHDFVDAYGQHHSIGVMTDASWVSVTASRTLISIPDLGVAPLIALLDGGRACFEQDVNSFLAREGVELMFCEFFPLTQFICECLQWVGGEAWPDKALSWILDDDPPKMINKISTALFNEAENLNRSQSFRHRSRKIAIRLRTQLERQS